MARASSNILLPYENKWVAVSKDGKKVVASATDVKVLSEKLEKLNIADAIMTWVMPFNHSFSPFHV